MATCMHRICTVLFHWQQMYVSFLYAKKCFLHVLIHFSFTSIQYFCCTMNILRNTIAASFIIFMLIGSYAFTSAPDNITLEIKQLRSAKGNLIIGVFKDGESFKNEKPFKRLTIQKPKPVKGSCAVSLTLEPGVYGISILDDENANDEMDYNMIGIPKEGFGFSNYYHTALSRPKFESFKLKIENREKIAIRMKYY